MRIIKLYNIKQYYSNIKLSRFITSYSLIFVLLFVGCVLVRIIFFKSELWVWDSGEFASCIDNLIFPHLPYVGYMFLGILCKYIIPLSLDLSLSLLSLVFGSLVIFPFFILAFQVLQSNRAALFATFLFAFAPVIILQSGYQEIYASQCFFVLLSIALLLYKHQRAFYLSAILFGFSITVNIVNILLIPFFFLGLLRFRKINFLKIQLWFTIAGIVVLLAFIWTFIEFNSMQKAIDYWCLENQFDNLFKAVLSNSNEIKILDILKSRINNFDWVIDKVSSQMKSMFFTMTPLLTIIGVTGFCCLFFRNRQWWIMLGIFALPYLLFDLTYPQKFRAIWLYMTFFLPALAIWGAACIEHYLSNNKLLYLRTITVIVFFVLYLLQSIYSPLLYQDDEQYVYNLHNYFKWIREVTPQNSLLLTEREPWILFYYTDRSILYSNFNDDWQEKITFYPKKPKMMTANDHIQINFNKIVGKIRDGELIFSTTKAPFGEFIYTAKPNINPVPEIIDATIYNTFYYTTKQTLKRIHLYDNFMTDIGNNTKVQTSNIAYFKGLVCPAIKGRPATLTYEINVKESFYNLILESQFYLWRKGNYAEILISLDNKKYKKVYQIDGTDQQQIDNPLLDLSSQAKGHDQLYVKILLFRDNTTPGYLIDCRVEEVKIYSLYSSMVQESLPLYQLTQKKLHLYDNFMTDIGNNTNAQISNIAHLKGLVYPAFKGRPATLTYEINVKESFHNLILESQFYVWRKGNYAEILISHDNKKYKKVYQLHGTDQQQIENPLLDISSEAKGHDQLYVKILLFRDDAVPGPLIDCRMEKIKIYSYKT